MKRNFIHLSLFLITLLTTTLSGAEWMHGSSFFWVENTMSWEHFVAGFHFSIPFLFILTAHEFGHYFTARSYRIRVSLPYYIPMWLGFLPIPSPSIGTIGAFIRIIDRMKTPKEVFDVGVAGPLAGFIPAIILLTYGFTHLPPPEHIFTIHPEYEKYGLDYAQHIYQETKGLNLRLGDNLIFWFFKNYVADPELLPHPYELMHYPYIFAGFLALFFTALNLMPIGQLDGGHILFGLIGRRWHNIVSPIIYVIFMFYAGLGMPIPLDIFGRAVIEWSDVLTNFLYFMFLWICFKGIALEQVRSITVAVVVFGLQYIIALYYPSTEGYSGWLLFGLLLGRFLGIYHPPALYEEPLSLGRKIIGWISLLIFVLSVTPQPFIIE